MVDKIYTIDVHFKSGDVMRGVTVKKLEIENTKISWEAGGGNPLVYINFDEIAGIVCRNEEANPASGDDSGS